MEKQPKIIPRKKLYEQRDNESNHILYFRHLDAMTRESLYSKADIASELAYRDAEIERLEEEVAILRGKGE